MRCVQQIVYLICILSISGASLKTSCRPIFQRQKPGGRQKTFIVPPYRGLNASRVFIASAASLNFSSKFSSITPTRDISIHHEHLNSNSFTELNDLAISTSEIKLNTKTSIPIPPANTLILSENKLQAKRTLYSSDSPLLSSYGSTSITANKGTGNMQNTDSATISVYRNSNATLSNRPLWQSQDSSFYTSDVYSADLMNYSSLNVSLFLTAALMPTSVLSLETSSNKVKHPVITSVSTDSDILFTINETIVSSASSPGYLTNTDQLEASFPLTVSETSSITPTPTIPLTQSIVQSSTATVQTKYTTAPLSSIQSHNGITSDISSVNLFDSDESIPSSLNHVKSNILPITYSMFSMVYGSACKKQTNSSSALITQPPSLSIFLSSWTTATVQSPVTTPALATVSSISSIYGVTSSSTPVGAYTCLQMSSYFPTRVEIDESEPVGTILASMPAPSGSCNITFVVTVKEPTALTNIMKGYFKIDVSSSDISVVLAKPVDVEQLYHLSGNTTPVKDLLVEVQCTETLHSSVIKETFSINITIWDEDDESPQFQNQDDDKTCVVPVYKADASEDYMGELTTKPGKLEAVDGDLFVQHNISYAVMHAEPENYHVYFSLNTFDGSVNKTRLMNASDPRKYVLFIQAIEDSPQQKKKVAVLSIEVFAPSDPLEDYTHEVDPTVKLSLKVASALVLLGFASGFIVLVHYRWRRKRGRFNSNKSKPCELARDMKIELAVYQSSCSSLECEQAESTKDKSLDTPSIVSPSQLQVAPNIYHRGYRKTKKVIVKKPIDTKLRPGWNAPTLKKKPVVYSPYKTSNITKLV